MTLKPHDLERIIAVVKAETSQFVRLSTIAELNPSVDFRHADLRAINLYREDLAGFDLTGSDLSGADLRSADLRNTSGLYGAILTDVIFDEYTMWPPRRVRIVNKRGLHARASAQFVMLSERFNADIWVTRDGQSVPARSIMGLMMLGAGFGVELEIGAVGPDAKSAMDALAELIAGRFGQAE
jgi:phosphocarrier protein